MAEYKAEYENNDATRCAQKTFQEFEGDYRDVPGKDYIKTLNAVAKETTFYQKTYDCVKEKHKFDGFVEDADSLANFVFDLVCNLGKDENDEPLISSKTVGNWFKKSPPSSVSREKVYILCFALGLNSKETKEFFLKAYLDRPFNYKNINEATYFFCMNNRLSYDDARRIITTIEKTPCINNPDAEDNTEQIGDDISNIKTEEEFIKYIINNRSGFSTQNKTATEKVQELEKECEALATDELNQVKDIIGKEFSVTNSNELLDVICGYSARGKNGKSELKFSITNENSKFPDRIKTNFPQEHLLRKILAGKEKSFDVIRKALILLKFYHFFMDAQLNGESDTSKYWFDEFVEETNTLLAECGYVQLYWRNPYDWMFGYCANSADVIGEYEPIEQFRHLIEEFYLKDANPNGKYYDETVFTN